MTTRKTISVSSLKQKVNEMLAQSICRHERFGMIRVLEFTLHETGNYRGFRYLTEREVPTGELPGINVDDKGPLDDILARFQDTDCTRVEYR